MKKPPSIAFLPPRLHTMVTNICAHGIRRESDGVVTHEDLPLSRLRDMVADGSALRLRNLGKKTFNALLEGWNLPYPWQRQMDEWDKERAARHERARTRALEKALRAVEFYRLRLLAAQRRRDILKGRNPDPMP